MWASLKRFSPVEMVVVLLITIILLSIAVPSVVGAVERHKENAQAGEAANIALAMFNYNTDNGSYPSGLTSTSIFQQLYDRHFLGDRKPVKLTSADVRWDVAEHDDGTGLTGADPADLPLMISTGFGPQRFQSGAEVSVPSPGTIVRLDMSTSFIRMAPKFPASNASLPIAPSAIGPWYKTVTPR